MRHLYYRIWSTVSKFSNSSWFPDRLADKNSQELYAMMAYGLGLFNVSALHNYFIETIDLFQRLIPLNSIVTP